ncbi:MAG: tRNA 2-thiouridine(34) synthase MnmA [Clostridiales Family XIII bacterium]|jgi:tRNA-specific 2-thiouridylase|nr:tRNA 2-thiouridine(34) synthase MnmA [Clostridiales Family XIII bacterium]
MGGKPKALIAMSGGVDSSVAALLPQRMGYDCVGATMKLFENEDIGERSDRPCCSLADASDAARVAAALSMPHYVFDFTEAFRVDVIDRFASSYEAGATPSPCIDCNTYLKFGRLFERARTMGFDKIVTGHYARICPGANGRYTLERAADLQKDQTYFLYTMTQELLAHTLFPLGPLHKRETRAIAAEAGFANAEKRESQDICFVASGDYAGFIEAYRGRAFKPGNFVDTSGRALGRHGGIERYTIGQRKGLGIALGRPVFVKEIRPDANEVVLAEEAEVFASSIEIQGVNLIAAPRPFPERAQIMIRYNARLVWAAVAPLPGGGLRAVFDEAVRAPAKGQAAVLYDGGRVIGGGRIG